jgi:hypothetical protein
VTLTLKQHHRSSHRKDALVHDDHFPIDFWKIFQLQPKIFAILVGGVCNLIKTLHPNRIGTLFLGILTQILAGECHQCGQQLHQVSSTLNTYVNEIKKIVTLKWFKFSLD